MGVVAGATWLVTAAIFRYSSLAALLTAALMPLWTMVFDFKQLFPLSLGLACVIYWRHRENIIRLIRGQESKIGKK
jgi:glycerol-3-phosphate acyltransferase PlsY